jgi:hypothetical protein
MSRKSSAVSINNDTQEYIKEEKETKNHRLDLNTLLNRVKEQKKKDRNTQIVIGVATLIIFTAAVFLYTLFT